MAFVVAVVEDIVIGGAWRGRRQSGVLVGESAGVKGEEEKGRWVLEEEGEEGKVSREIAR